MSARVRAVQERRRSNAAGPHSTRPTRAERLAAVLADFEDDDQTPTPDPATEVSGAPLNTAEPEGPCPHCLDGYPAHKHHDGTRGETR